ncbi:MAG: hypothetical protein R3E89_15545 [Thiolinea sp.]
MRISLDEDGDPLTLRDVATRWLAMYPEILPEQGTDSWILTCLLPQYLNAGGHQKLKTVTKNVWRERKGGFVSIGVDGGVVQRPPKEQIQLLCVERAELNRFERENFHMEHDKPESNEFDSFDLDSDVYPPELDIAFQAWRAVAINGQGGEGTAKQRLEAWLRGSGYGLKDEAIKRIATVCNWDKGRGRKK